MAHIMEILTQDMHDAVRLEDLKASDEAERALQEADLAYLRGAPERERRRVAIAHEAELVMLRAAGAL